MKTCNRCKIKYSDPHNNFNKNKRKNDGLDINCKKCRSTNYKLHYKINKEKILSSNKSWLKTDEGKKYIKEYRKSRRYKQKEWRENNKEYIKTYAKNYKQKRNLDKRIRYNIDPEFKLIETLRKQLGTILKVSFIKKENSVMKLIGCSVSELKLYLESLFKENMTWNNWGKGEGKWHVDHIIPCAYFELSDPEQQKLCFHYTNLQPLWEKDNVSKKSLYNGNYYTHKK